MDDFTQKDYIPITSWAEEDRPREKLLKHGRGTLSDAEILAILIGSGSRSESAIDLCKRILLSCNNNLNELAKFSIEDLIKFKGIGEAKAISIISALELGRRRKSDIMIEKNQIKSSKDAFDILSTNLSDLAYEEFWIIILNRANKVIDKVMISRGGVSGTVSDMRLIFKIAIEKLASGIILAHNHPSGNLTTSNADVQITNKAIEIGKLMDVIVLDHIIIGDGDYYSFKDEGLI